MTPLRAPDLLVVGAGVFGLSVGWAARRAGLTVRVLEAERIGGGASGGPVGALVPHAPGRWSPLHAFQLAALASLPARIALIEAASGRSTGYARTGRLTPLGTAEARARAVSNAVAARRRWGDAAGRWEVLEAVPPEAAGWLAPEAAPHGLVRDSLSARIDPPAYLAALAACLGDDVAPGRVLRLDTDPSVVTAEGRLTAGHVVVAAGWRSWSLVAPLAPGLAGGAVKGQAALLAARAGARPLITAQRLYVVPHEHGIGVGSTSEPDFADAHATDERLDQVIERARALCPALAHAPVLRRWAGLRPRPPGRVPVIGPLPGHPGLWIASGGRGIGLGIAHAAADALVARITGGDALIALPSSFAPGGGG